MNPIRVSLSDHPVFGNIFQDLAIWVKSPGCRLVLFYGSLTPNGVRTIEVYLSDPDMDLSTLDLIMFSSACTPGFKNAITLSIGGQVHYRILCPIIDFIS